MHSTEGRQASLETDLASSAIPNPAQMRTLTLLIPSRMKLTVKVPFSIHSLRRVRCQQPSWIQFFYDAPHQFGRITAYFAEVYAVALHPGTVLRM